MKVKRNIERKETFQIFLEAGNQKHTTGKMPMHVPQCRRVYFPHISLFDDPNSTNDNKAFTNYSSFFVRIKKARQCMTKIH